MRTFGTLFSITVGNLRLMFLGMQDFAQIPNPLLLKGEVVLLSLVLFHFYCSSRIFYANAFIVGTSLYQANVIVTCVCTVKLLGLLLHYYLLG